MLFAFISACATIDTNLAQYDAAMSTPLAPDMARINFVRKSALLDALVTHYIFDCGTNIKFDSTLIEKSQLILNKAADGSNLPLFVGIIEAQKEMPPNSTEKDNAFIALNKQVKLDGTMLKSLAFTGQMHDWAIPENLEEKPKWFAMSLFEYRLKVGIGGKRVSGVEGIKYLASMISPNARYIGPIESGDATVFDRPQGTLRLKAVMMNGTEMFAPDFPIKRGKMYTVIYSIYDKFTISERP